MATGLRRLDSFEKHKDSFTQLFSKCVGKMKDTPNIKNPQALEVLAEQIKDKFGAEVNHDLEKIWDEFDTDKNGILDEEENIKLTKNFLMNMKDWFRRMMEEVLGAAANPDVAGTSDKGQTFVKNVFAGTSEELKPVVEELFAKLLEDVKPMAKETYGLMDMNKDGKVVKSEFMSTFMSCAAEIIRQLTLRAMYAVLSSGKVDFSKFVEDLDEEPGEDSTVIKNNFNAAVREVASAQLASASPLNLHEFWTSVCLALRKKVGVEPEANPTPSVLTTSYPFLPSVYPQSYTGGYLASPTPYLSAGGMYGGASWPSSYPWGGAQQVYGGVRSVFPSSTISPFAPQVAGTAAIAPSAPMFSAFSPSIYGSAYSPYSMVAPSAWSAGAPAYGGGMYPSSYGAIYPPSGLSAYPYGYR